MEMHQKEVGQQYHLLMKINSVTVPTKNIQSFVLREWIFDHVLSMECFITDNGVFVEQSPLYDDCLVEVEFSKNDEADKVVLKFGVNDFEIERQGSGDIFYGIRFTAIQKTVDMTMPVYTKVYPRQTVSTAIGNVIKNETDVKLVKRVETNDSQNWYQIATSNNEFLYHLKKRSYVADEDMVFAYMTRYKEMVITSLKTECNKTPEFIAYNSDIASLDNGIDNVISKIKDDKQKIKPLYFKSHIKYKNVAGTLNKKAGYGINFSYYDFENLYYHYLNYNYGPMTKYLNENKANSQKVVNSITYNSLHRNVHKNYLMGVCQNMYMGHSFFNSYIQIAIGPDMGVNLFDKITLNIPDAVGQIVNGKPLLDKVHSGDYIVGGILHDIRKDGMYSMILTLFRNGINSSDVKDVKIDLQETTV